MRKPQPAAFGARGLDPATATKKISRKVLPPIFAEAARRISYGLAIKVAVILWVFAILAVIFWPLIIPLVGLI